MMVETEVRCNLCDIKFTDKPSLMEHIQKNHVEFLPELQSDHKDVKEEEVKYEEVKEEKLKLRYVLDKLKNMKVAKTNAKRPMESQKHEVNDLNVRFELNSALYLVSKEELTKLVPGQSALFKGVKVDIESKTNHVDIKDNNPATVMKVKVTEVKSGFESKVTINLYHTNQGIHLQGGRRNGNVTSCSLLGNFLESFFEATLTKHAKK